MPRVVVLGCGTGVGKTWTSVALLSALRRRGADCIGLKPIESGMAAVQSGLAASDAAVIAHAGSLPRRSGVTPLYAFDEPISPHLAARRVGVTIDTGRAAAWVSQHEAANPRTASRGPLWTIIETAGGVFSPLGPRITNFDLALRLEPAIWILVAADALGVLHDVTATLLAMTGRGRTPEHVVLSGAREADASTGSNAAELSTLCIATPSAVLRRDDQSAIEPLVEGLLTTVGERRPARPDV